MSLPRAHIRRARRARRRERRRQRRLNGTRARRIAIARQVFGALDVGVELAPHLLNLREGSRARRVLGRVGIVLDALDDVLEPEPTEADDADTEDTTPHEEGGHEEANHQEAPHEEAGPGEGNDTHAGGG